MSSGHLQAGGGPRRCRVRACTRAPRGFTLLECLLAGVLLAGFAAGLTAAMRSATTAQQAGVGRLQAAGHLDSLLARIDAVGVAAWSQDGPFSGQLPGGQRWSATTQTLPDTGLHRVDVAVTWPVPGGQRRATAHTLLRAEAASGLRWDDLDWTGAEP